MPSILARLRHGDLVCFVHGRVDAAITDGELPICALHSVGSFSLTGTGTAAGVASWSRRSW
jgi:hypothetical protein